ncbi:MAG: segregation ATPase FtsK/SpoIIIE -like protein, partial [Sphaerisporangium sp.]|nr:segregation ATPase FtsK/SpoIIIE -like protein [Sphaerisporangium sp.]
MPMVAGGAAMALMFTAGGGGNPIMYVASGMFALSMVGMSLSQLGRASGERKLRLNGLRRDYFRYLSQTRKKVRRAARRQREALHWNGPDPDSLWSVVMGPRLWERRPRDGDFATVRVGTGTQRLAVQLIPPDSKPVEDLDAMSAGALRRFVRAHSSVEDLPIAMALHSFARILPTGDPGTVRDLVRALVGQLAVFHSPDDMRVAVCASKEWMAQWEWVKWLPHALHPEETDAAGPVRLMADDLRDLDRLLGGELKDRGRFRPGASLESLPYHVVIVDGGYVPQDSQLGADAIQGVTIIDLGGFTSATEEGITLRLEVLQDRFNRVQLDHAGKEIVTGLGRPDRLSFLQADGLARQLAPLRASTAKSGDGQDVLAANMTLTDLLGVADPRHLDIPALWRPRAPRNRMRVPIGLGGDGRMVELDIKESAQGGMGPHGLIIGATGSGKSELVRTLVLGLATTHSSEILNFVLVDFKGGATFIGMDKLPHTSAMITNLADELPLVDRMQDSINGELIRRQELLRASGYASLFDYEKARANGEQLAPFPILFVIVDEFSELLGSKAEFMDLFVSIGRLGRSLGVHLLLASQRLDEGRIHRVEGHLSYRIALRTFSSMESRSVIGVAKAYELPSEPGNGYLKLDTTNLLRFKGAYVSGPCATVAPDSHSGGEVVAVQEVVPFVTHAHPSLHELLPAPVEAEKPEKQPDPATPNEKVPSLADVLIERLAGSGPPARQVWLPPLAESPSLDTLLPSVLPDPVRGMTVEDQSELGRLRVPIGMVDRPYEQVRELLVADLSGADGHVAVVGAPQTGKSTMLRTLMLS